MSQEIKANANKKARSKKIAVLSASLQNKIAAGEVIERPASVVKELLENAIDAGATTVSIDISGAGIKAIRVRDDGGGISPEDLPVAVQKHATSKIHTLDELFDIQTMGFRGEALASIAAISEMTIASCKENAKSASEIGVKGGNFIYQKEIAMPRGTTITVRNLFFNTPVRRKFLKSQASEIAAVTESVLRIALAYPEVEIILQNEGKDVFHLPRTAELKERIAAVFSPQFVKDLIQLPDMPGNLVGGYISKPALTRPNTRDQYIFLNKRYIKDKSIYAAIKEAYKTLMAQRRFPAVFVFLELDTSEFDVNVHPTKIEVRFRDSAAVYLAVFRALRYALENMDISKSMSFGTASHQPLSTPDKKTATAHQYIAQKKAPATEKKRLESASMPEKPLITAEMPYTAASRPANNSLKKSVALSQENKKKKETVSNDSAPADYPEFKYLGQIRNSYLAVETAENVMLIDQHALHERILYDKFKTQNKNIPLQRLLIPEKIELGAHEVARLNMSIQLLNNMGFEITQSGRNILIKSIPTMLGRSSAGQVVFDILNCGEDSKSNSLEDERERIAKSLSCKGAIKAGDVISDTEAKSLIRDYLASPTRFTCPHGRPTALSISWDEMEKQFKRK